MGVNRKQFLFNEIVAADSTKNTEDIFNGDVEETYWSMVNAGAIPASSSAISSLVASRAAPSGTVITDTNTFKLDNTARPLVPVKEINCLGHSMMYSSGGIVENRINAALGVTVYNMGVGGNTSTDIAIRGGGIIPLVTFTGGSIPADTSSVAVTVQPSREFIVSVGGNPFTYIGTIVGIAGTLTYATATGLWTFNRTTAGTLTTVPANSPFIITSSTYLDRVCVIWPGRNNLYAQSQDMRNVVRDVDTIINALTPYQKQYLVLSDFTSTVEGRGTSNYNKTVISSNDRATRYGKNFYDLRRDFIDKGLAIAGITPTAADLAAIAADTCPPSLMNTAGDHPNDTYGYPVVGTLISRKLSSMNWGFTYISTNKLTANQASIEIDASGWSGNGDNAIVLSRSTLFAADGTSSLEVTAAPSGIANIVIANPGVSVTPGQYLAFQMVSRSANIPRQRKIDVYFYDTNSAFLSNVQGTPTLDSTTGWTLMTLGGTLVPASAAFVRFGLASSGDGAGEKHYIDKASLSVVGSAGAPAPVWEMP